MPKCRCSFHTPKYVVLSVMSSVVCNSTLNAFSVKYSNWDTALVILGNLGSSEIKSTGAVRVDIEQI